jgi:protein-tyrosine phosphatase
MIDAPPVTHIEIEGCLNFRDAGGWIAEDGRAMAMGRLYRSDDPIRLTDAGRAAVAALGLARVVDVRQWSQIGRSPGFISEDRTIHQPLVDRVVDPANPPRLVDPADLATLYENMIEVSRAEMATVLDALAEGLTEGPVLVHCAFGKDRTGLAVALIGAAIGLPAAAIVTDYGRSDDPCWARRQWIEANRRPDDPDFSHVPDNMFRAPEEAMAILLERSVARYGSLRGWVESFPIGPGTIDRFVAALLVE